LTVATARSYCKWGAGRQLRDGGVAKPGELIERQGKFLVIDHEPEAVTRDNTSTSSRLHIDAERATFDA
jgi:hypothetical protein